MSLAQQICAHDPQATTTGRFNLFNHNVSSG